MSQIVRKIQSFPIEIPLTLAPRYLRARGVCEHFQIARSTLWLWAKTRPGFPQPLKAGEKVTLFDLNAIETYLVSQAKQGRAQ